jgi:hypothetical protein
LPGGRQLQAVAAWIEHIMAKMECLVNPVDKLMDYEQAQAQSTGPPSTRAPAFYLYVTCKRTVWTKRPAVADDVSNL